METAKRLIHLDLIKILAIFLVIFNHTSERGFSLFASWPRGSVRYFTYLVPSVFCKVAIFLFFMVSGALLLNRDYSLRDIWTKKIPRIAGALLLVSVLTFVWREHGNFSEGLLPMLRHFFAGLYTGGIDAIFWFLYAYLAFLMALPVLRAIVKALPAAGYQYIILLYLAFECIGALEYLLFRGGHTLSHYLIPSFLFQYIFFYPLMGYYLERVLPSEAVTGKKLALLNAGGLLTILAGGLLTWFKHGVLGTFTIADTSTFMLFLIFIPCAAVYLDCRALLTAHPPGKRMSRFLLEAGSCVFGIYLFHIYFLFTGPFADIPAFLQSSAHFNDLGAAVVYCLFAMLASGLVTLVLRQIPGIRKLL